MKKKILITGSAGFIGSHLSNELLKKGYQVVGIDNLNAYYSVALKKSRNSKLLKYKNYKFYKKDITNKIILKKIFKSEKIDYVVNLAAQAGVRYSLHNPKAYIDTNIIGFFNLLDLAKEFKVKHFVYASSSSVYGLNNKHPFSEKDTTDHPISMYAATKKTNEIMAHSYSHLYKMPTTGLRFFTVYGPGGRPDMSMSLFVDAISKKKYLDLFNRGDMKRSFTYIDDITNGLLKIIFEIPKSKKKIVNANFSTDISSAPYEIYNLGNPKEVKLKKYLKLIEKKMKSKTKINFLNMQKGDVKSTRANINKYQKKFGKMLKIDIQEGIDRYVDWYNKYHGI